MHVSFPFIIHLAQIGQKEFEHSLLLHISHTGEVGYPGGVKKRKHLTQFNSVMVFSLDFAAVSVTGTVNPSTSFLQL